MRRIIKFSILQAILVYCAIWANEPDDKDEQVFPVDLSVFDGNGSLLLDWSFPDSILLGETRIYVQKSGDAEFNLLTMNPSKKQRYLDQNCEANSRYFYMVEIKDIFGRVFSSDSETPVFGTCLDTEDSASFDQSVGSISDLLLTYIQNKLTDIFPYTNYRNLIDLISINDPTEKTWIENYPLFELVNVDEMISTLSSIIMDSNILQEILEFELDYRNKLLITPDEWPALVEDALLTVQKNWQLLILSYPKTIALIKNIDPIRIIGLNISEEDQRELYLYRFRPEQNNVSEAFLLSGDEYIDLGEFKIENESLISVSIPEHWEYVDLILDNILLEQHRLNFQQSVSFTINGDITPSEEPFNLKVGKDNTSLWLNELIWNPSSSQLQLEVAGSPEYEEYFSIYLGDKSIWEIDQISGFETQFSDSLITLESDIHYPIEISFENQINGLRESIEYIVLDTIPIMIQRYPDGGPWQTMEFSTMGKTNDPELYDYEAELLPELFVLYQNYPNPFNGLTRITFDLLDDAVISLFVTDATGRIHDKFVEDQYTNSGTYHFEWNGDGKSTGIYFFTIQAQVGSMPPAIMSRKMIYLK
tara:strand:- start:40 stop:1809 length:1770 start_codon:yes stop_codon:yes gene_type:complete